MSGPVQPPPPPQQPHGSQPGELPPHPYPAGGASAPPFPQGSFPPPGAPSGSNGLAVAGFVLGLIALLTCWVPVLNVVSIGLGVIGGILAIVGLVAVKKKQTGKGLAIAGLVLSLVAIVLAILINVVVVAVVGEAGKVIGEEINKATSTSVTTPDGQTSSTLGNSADDPAPFGSTVHGNNWDVTVNSASAVEQDALGESPQPGSALLLVNITATFTGDDAEGATPWATVKFQDPQGTVHDSSSSSSVFVAEDPFDSFADVQTGQSVSGNLVVEIPAENWQNGLIVVSPDFIAQETYLAAQ